MNRYEKAITRTKRWMGAEAVVWLVFFVLLLDGINPLDLFIVVVTSIQLIYGYFKINRLRNKQALESL